MANERLIAIHITTLDNGHFELTDTPDNKVASMVLAQFQSGTGAYVTNEVVGRLWIPTTAVAAIAIIAMNDGDDTPPEE